MAITADEIMQELENNRAVLVQHMVDECKRDITNRINWALAEEVSKLVKTYIQEEIAPEIKAVLLQNKSAILQATILMSEELTKDLTDAMLKKARENLHGYGSGDIMKALFK